MKGRTIGLLRVPLRDSFMHTLAEHGHQLHLNLFPGDEPASPMWPRATWQLSSFGKLAENNGSVQALRDLSAPRGDATHPDWAFLVDREANESVVFSDAEVHPGPRATPMLKAETALNVELAAAVLGLGSVVSSCMLSTAALSAFFALTNHCA